MPIKINEKNELTDNQTKNTQYGDLIIDFMIKFPNTYLELRIGKPIRTENIHFEDRHQFVADVRQEVIALKNQWNNAE